MPPQNRCATVSQPRAEGGAKPASPDRRIEHARLGVAHERPAAEPAGIPERQVADMTQMTVADRTSDAAGRRRSGRCRSAAGHRDSRGRCWALSVHRRVQPGCMQQTCRSKRLQARASRRPAAAGPSAAWSRDASRAVQESAFDSPRSWVLRLQLHLGRSGWLKEGHDDFTAGLCSLCGGSRREAAGLATAQRLALEFSIRLK